MVVLAEITEPRIEGESEGVAPLGVRQVCGEDAAHLENGVGARSRAIGGGGARRRRVQLSDEQAEAQCEDESVAVTASRGG
jgi:hypothetical protein